MPIKEATNLPTPKGQSKRKSNDPSQRRWQDAPKASAGRMLFNWASNIEATAWPRRFANLTYYRYMTGRPVNPHSYNFSMTSRPSSIAATYGRSRFSAPTFNAMAQCDDVLANRVYCNQPDPFVQPIAGDFGERMRSRKLTRWLQAAFRDLNIWDVVQLCGLDSRMYGTGYVKVDVGLDGKPSITRFCDDEVILDETECSVSDNPRTMGVRLFVSRDELLSKFGKDPEAAAAIARAPKASLGFYFGNDLDVSDVVVLVEGWHLGTKDKPGRHVLAVGDYALTDEKYKADHFPIAKLVYKRMSSGWRGQGMAEQVLPLQRELERLCAAYSENVQRMAWPRVGIPNGSGINEAALAAKSGGTFKFNPGQPPQFFNPESITTDQFRYLDTIVRQIRERVGISDQAAAGVKPPGLNSGLAIERQSQLDDGRHKELALELERFVCQIAELLVEAAEKCKPTVYQRGRRVQPLKWADVAIARSSYRVEVLPLSSLPNSIPGRTEIIEQWAAQGRISKATQNRLEQVPDIDGYLDLANAGAESVDAALDRIVEDGEYEPPTPFADLQDQLGTAQSRYLFEKDQGDTPRDRLDLLLQYIAATQELIEEAAPAPSAPAPGFGMQPPAGAPPVAQPYPMAPNVQMAA